MFESDGGADTDGGAMGAFPAAREVDELGGSPSDIFFFCDKDGLPPHSVHQEYERTQ